MWFSDEINIRVIDNTFFFILFRFIMEENIIKEKYYSDTIYQWNNGNCSIQNIRTKLPFKVVLI